MKSSKRADVVVVDTGKRICAALPKHEVEFPISPTKVQTRFWGPESHFSSLRLERFAVHEMVGYYDKEGEECEY